MIAREANQTLDRAAVGEGSTPRSGPGGAWQFSLRGLFLTTTVVAIFFAFPQFSVTALCLLAATIGALATFMLLFYLPVLAAARILGRLGNERSTPAADERRRSGMGQAKIARSREE